MADSKLRLQIVTALDNAGLKATKEQIDGIEKSIQKTNATGGLGKVEKQLGGMHGPLGKLGPMFEGLGGKVAQFGATAMAVIGAFKTGWDIGNWLQEHVIAPLFNLKNPIEELKNQNKALRESQENALQAVGQQASNANALFSHANKDIDNQITYIDKLQQAWVRATRAKNGYINADQDVHIQRLERERFERVVQLQNNGDIEGAEQMNAYYDFLKTVTEEQLATDKAQQEFEIMQKNAEVNRGKRQSYINKITAAENNVDERKKLLDMIDDDPFMFKTKYEYERERGQAFREWENALMELDNRRTDLDVYDMDVATKDQEIQNRAMQIVAMRDKSQLAIDQSAWGYDQWVNEHGNPLNFQFDPEFIKQLTESEQGTYNNMENIEEAVAKGIREGFSELMEVK